MIAKLDLEHILFLDIEMPGESGFELLKALQPETYPAIIFVTAYDEFAIQAFKANAIDYVLKPIEEGRLQQALTRVRETMDQKQAVGSFPLREYWMDVAKLEDFKQAHIDYSEQFE